MINNQFIINKFGFLGKEFLCELDKHAVVTEIKAKTEIISLWHLTLLISLF